MGAALSRSSSKTVARTFPKSSPAPLSAKDTVSTGHSSTTNNQDMSQKPIQDTAESYASSFFNQHQKSFYLDRVERRDHLQSTTTNTMKHLHPSPTGAKLNATDLDALLLEYHQNSTSSTELAKRFNLDPKIVDALGSFCQVPTVVRGEGTRNPEAGWVSKRTVGK